MGRIKTGIAGARVGLSAGGGELPDVPAQQYLNPWIISNHNDPTAQQPTGTSLPLSACAEGSGVGESSGSGS